MEKLDDLVTKYFNTDLGIIFNQVGIDTKKIPEINHQILKETTLAQWLLESGRGNSELAIQANNFAGLKWRDPDMRGFAEPLKIKVQSEVKDVEFCQFKDIDAFLIGYWKFLTRSPYKGLEEHTNTPENFVGFIKTKGYSADPNYVAKVINLLPEAQKLLASATGVVIPSVPEQLQLIRAPKEVVIGQVFSVEGKARLADKGKVLSVTVDDKLTVESVTIGQDGKWQFEYAFTKTGDRKILLTVANQSLELRLQVFPITQQNDSLSNDPGAKIIKLSGSVGVGGVNKADDIKAIKARLYELGYTWVGDPHTPLRDRGLDEAIRLFQSIIAGRSTVKGDGRVDVNGITHQWLQAANAPKWVIMPDSDLQNGFVNAELAQTNDQHDFGTHWLANAIKDIAQDYHQNYRRTRPNTAPFAINDVSLPHGGDTPDHQGHETGMMCDVFLPKKDGSFGGIFWTSPQYDQEAARAILQSIRRQKLVRVVFFNDRQLIAEGLCQAASGHDHHIHFEINPPFKA
ncbi:glucosaminidase domain-containing protein [Nostoc sp. FACHB-110]|uniref:glucosaminidase domain-containing protein n=1 Tax=Nostoc sp. FACHB-110 TaxID=2692834 RepID=UPI001689AC07|nr:glucosaminidase domain-containing protein [Nostoc sp. FACHB-110]MBD2438395.1 glucosaminidase domain-containing protein [Nostoc sp. FACHB-110]